MHEFSNSTSVILDEAQNRGVRFETILARRAALLKYGRHEEIIFFQFTSLTSAVGHQSCSYKDVTKEFLRRAGISVAEGRTFRGESIFEIIQYTKGLGWPVVVKPVDGKHGDFVYVGVDDEDGLVTASENIKCANPESDYIIEKMFKGTEYRIFATRDKYVACTQRIPANVVGDGEHTISELVEIKNQDPRRGDKTFSDPKKPLVKIEIDEIVVGKLQKQGITQDSVPKAGEQIFLRETSNISTGGDSIDCTDLVHDSVKGIAARSIRAIPGLAYGGIDFMTTDIGKIQTRDDYIVVEINASPGIDMHHFPYEGKPRNVAKEIIDLVFPETKRE